MHKDDIIARTIETSEEAKRQLELFNNYMRKERHPLDVVKRVYKLIDKTLEADGIPSQSACKPLCSKCCTIRVDLSKAEAYAISKAYSVEVKAFPSEPHFDTTEYPQGDCPFLYANACQIYPLRPIVCRMYHSMEDTPEHCGPGKKSTQFNLGCSPVIEQIAQMIMKDNESLCGGGDIRYFFGKDQIIIKE